MKKLIRLLIVLALIAAAAYFGIPRDCDRDGERKPYLICLLEQPAEEDQPQREAP